MYVICDIIKLLCITGILGILFPILITIYSNLKFNS